MDPQQLHKSLQDLHQELEHTPTPDDESRELLQHLQRDIQAVLKEPNTATRQTLGKRLKAAIAHFEDSHSKLTLTFKQILDNLAQI